jgi:hypothetical protein
MFYIFSVRYILVQIMFFPPVLDPDIMWGYHHASYWLLGLWHKENGRYMFFRNVSLLIKFLLVACIIHSFILETEALRSSETLVSAYHTKRHHVPEDSTLHQCSFPLSSARAQPRSCCRTPAHCISSFFWFIFIHFYWFNIWSIWINKNKI